MASHDSVREPAAVSRQVGLDQAFDGGSLVALRSAVAAHGDRLGLAGERLGDLLLVAHELASNSVRHGGGKGRLRLWAANGAVYCEVEDRGGGFSTDATAVGYAAPAPGASNGRGLWLVRQLSDTVDIRTGVAGTAIVARIAL